MWRFCHPGVRIDVGFARFFGRNLIIPARVTRLADDPRIVPTTCQQERHIRRGMEGDLVHRSPGRDMILHRTDGEYRRPDIRQIDRPLPDRKLS